jgi:hypothetical protein
MMKLQEQRGKLVAVFDWVNGGPTEDNMLVVGKDRKINMETSTKVQLTLSISKTVPDFLVIDEVNWLNKSESYNLHFLDTSLKRDETYRYNFVNLINNVYLGLLEDKKLGSKFLPQIDKDLLKYIKENTNDSGTFSTSGDLNKAVLGAIYCLGTLTLPSTFQIRSKWFESVTGMKRSHFVKSINRLSVDEDDLNEYWFKPVRTWLNKEMEYDPPIKKGDTLQLREWDVVPKEKRIEFNTRQYTSEDKVTLEGTDCFIAKNCKRGPKDNYATGVYLSGYAQKLLSDNFPSIVSKGKVLRKYTEGWRQ